MSDILDSVPAAHLKGKSPEELDLIRKIMTLGESDSKMVASMDVSLMKEAVEILEHQRDNPLGSLGLPPLLDKRRFEYHIPGVYFDVGQYVGDWVLIYQIPVDAKTESGLLWKPDEMRWAETRGTTDGIICNAGLTARDTLISHGIDLGHRVRFMRQAPFHPLLGVYESTSREIRGIDCMASDIRCSVDLMNLLRSGKVVEKVRDVEWKGMKYPEHYYQDAQTGEDWSPMKMNLEYLEE